MDRELGDIETLKGKAVNYSSVDNPFLMPLDAFFVKVLLAISDTLKTGKTHYKETHQT